MTAFPEKLTYPASSPRPIISAIAIMTRERGIAHKGSIPSLLRIPDDRRRFKEITMGHALVMGRKTYQSAKIFPLVGRENIVLTRDRTFSASCSTVVHGKLWNALMIGIAHERKHFPLDQQEVFVIGGGEIYQLALPLVSRLYLTVVDIDIPCDTFFPAYEHLFTEEVPEFTKRELRHGVLPYSFIALERRR